MNTEKLNFLPLSIDVEIARARLEELLASADGATVLWLSERVAAVTEMKQLTLVLVCGGNPVQQ